MPVPSHRALVTLDDHIMVYEPTRTLHCGHLSVVERDVPPAMATDDTGNDPQPVLPGWRCHGCRAVLLRGVVTPGSWIEVQCQLCDTFNLLDTRRDDHAALRSSHATAVTPLILDTRQPSGDPIRFNRRRQTSHGQSLVEFAVLLPVLVLILALAADFGRAFTAYIAISGAAREGAAFGMQSTTTAIDTEGIQTAALGEANDPWGTVPTVSSQVGTDSLATGGYSYVEVTVNYAFSTLIPIPPIPSTINMQRQVRMRVLN